MHEYASCGLLDARRPDAAPHPRRAPRGERPVNDLVAAVDIHQSGVSRHLRILQEAGFVTVRPEGAQRFYALRARAVPRARRVGRRSTASCGRRASTGSPPRSNESRKARAKRKETAS